MMNLYECICIFMNQITNKTRFPIDIALLKAFEVTFFSKVLTVKDNNTKKNTIVNAIPFLESQNPKRHFKINLLYTNNL